MIVYRGPRDPWSQPAKWHRTPDCTALYYWAPNYWHSDIRYVSFEEDEADIPDSRRCLLAACWPTEKHAGQGVA